ncbi:MAG: PVC-type heme-binding CxxCH protein [Planctomycetaceae bacterium]
MPSRSLVLLFILTAPALAAEPTAPLSPEAAVKQMTLPEGFRAIVFAAEPDVVQPIAFDIDDRGRLWVVECLSYPDWTEDGTGHDRVVIFEDSDGDGRHDSRKVFWDQGGNLSGIAVGFGGVWLCATPDFLFLPDRNGDDRPDGPPETLLEGWDRDAKHNVFNGLTWGPDGWLYGCNGILATSYVGKPDATDDERIPLNCGIWRYHPTRHKFEVVCWGTTNPWGLDFNEFGQMFFTNCVINHLWHVIPGAHYERMYGEDLNPHVYGLMTSCADHIHWGGGEWTESRGGQGIHDKPGGGHAHAGCMIYLADNWPRQYRGKLYTHNLHGQRVNCDVLERHGSGYVGHHDADLIFAGPSWFRGLELAYGPDGGVYVTDWNDTGECHDYEDIQRQTGRIYKITYGETKPARVDLAKQSSRRLYELLFHDANEWYPRHALRLLQERAAAGEIDKDIVNRLRHDLSRRENPVHRLRAMWALHGMDALSEEDRLGRMDDEHDLVRCWAIRLELENSKAHGPRPVGLSKLIALAKTDPSSTVRLELASGLQRLPLEDRWELAAALLAHDEDVEDANIPLMLWYGIEPLVEADPQRAAGLILQSRIPLVRQHIARRIAANIE